MPEKNIKIVQKEDPVLRQEAKAVPVSEITSEKIKKDIEKMKNALDSQSDGVAIAAPQIGLSLRIFVISGKVFQLIKLQKNGTEEEIDFKTLKKTELDEVYINPKIIKSSKESEFMEEGCLSVRWLYGKVKRAKKVTIEAWNENGETFRRGAGGLLAQIFQHETDHLNGTLFIDKAVDIEEMEAEGNNN